MESGRALAEKKLLITSGPTRAPLDAVRYVSNRSSGRLGCRMAVEALRQGAEVTLVAGPESVVPAEGDLSPEERSRLRLVNVETVDDLLRALESQLGGVASHDAVIHAMAVLDYVPERAPDAKVPSGREEWAIRLTRTPKVIRKIKEWCPSVLLVGFKLEVQAGEAELKQSALKALRKSDADLVVANDLSKIRDETHPALIIDSLGTVLERPGTKTEIARSLCRLVGERLATR